MMPIKATEAGAQVCFEKDLREEIDRSEENCWFICSWCKKEFGKGTVGKSHGICSLCKGKLLESHLSREDG